MINILNKEYNINDIGIKNNIIDNNNELIYVYLDDLKEIDNKINSYKEYEDAYKNGKTIYYYNKEENKYKFLQFNFFKYNVDPLNLKSIIINDILFNYNDLSILYYKNNILIKEKLNFIHLNNINKYLFDKYNNNLNNDLNNKEIYIIDDTNTNYTKFIIKINKIRRIYYTDINLTENNLLN